jgi:hypothetical protein
MAGIKYALGVFNPNFSWWRIGAISAGGNAIIRQPG